VRVTPEGPPLPSTEVTVTLGPSRPVSQGETTPKRLLPVAATNLAQHPCLVPGCEGPDSTPAEDPCAAAGRHPRSHAGLSEPHRGPARYGCGRTGSSITGRLVEGRRERPYRAPPSLRARVAERPSPLGT
jgi:hypothetical protein